MAKDWIAGKVAKDAEEDKMKAEDEAMEKEEKWPKTPRKKPKDGKRQGRHQSTKKLPSTK